MAGVYAIVTAADQGWTSEHTLGFGGLSIILVGVFLAVQARVRNPLMPLRILRIRTLTGASENVLVWLPSTDLRLPATRIATC